MDEPTDSALSLPEDMNAATITDLRTLHAAYLERITALRGQDTLTIGEAAELRKLVGEANQITAAVSEASTVEELSDLPAEPVVPEPVVEPETPAEGEGDAGDGADETDLEDKTKPVAIAAGISARDLDVAGSGTQRPSEGSTSQARAPFRASVNLESAPAGAELSIDQIGQIMEDQQNASLKYARGAEQKIPLFSVDRYAGDHPKLSRQNGAVANTALLAMPQHPVTAAICGPLDIVRPIPNCVENSRIVRSRFRNIPAERGAFQFLRSIGLADVEDAVQIWTDAEQAAVDASDPTTWKTCHSLVCGISVPTEVVAMSSCMTVDTKQEFSAPEQIENALQTITALVDRTAERSLLTKVDSHSKNFTFTGNYGAVPSFVQLIETQLGAALHSFRGLSETGYEVWVQEGFMEQLVVDEWARGHHDTCCEDLQAKIERAIGIPIIDLPDGKNSVEDEWTDFTLPADGAGDVVMPVAPQIWRVRLVYPAAGFFFDVGEKVVSIMRSPELARQNKVQWFGEIFEGLDKQACQPWFSTKFTMCANGDRAGFSEPVVCTPPIS